MAAPIQTLALDPNYSILRRQIAPGLAVDVGGGATQFRDLYERPTYEFTVHDSMAVQATAEAFYGFAQYHKRSRPFWYSGNRWGALATPIVFGFGDGVRTEFLLNNRNIVAASYSIFGDGSPIGGVTVDLASGLVTFGSGAPADGVKLTAQYQCVYKCVFGGDSRVLLNEDEFYNALWRFEGIVLREVIP